MKARLIILFCIGAMFLSGPTADLVGQETGVSGAAIYKERCAYCHGAEGKGDGPPNGNLAVKSRDFTSGVYKIRSTESGSIPTDADLIRSISMGIQGTSMPAWKGLLSHEEIQAVAAYIKSLSPRFSSERPQPVSVPRRTSYPESGVRKGKQLYAKLECASCHGTDGQGTDAIATEFEDEWGNPIVATNLTEPWTFGGGSSTRDIYLRLRTGIGGTPMPSYKGAASDNDLYDVAQYVSSLARKPAWEMTAGELEQHYASLKEKAKEDPVSWGRYLVSFYGCSDCHTPINRDGSSIDGRTMAGGQKWSLEPYFTTLYTPNLTSDKETGLGRFTDDQIRDAMTRGIRPADGSRMLPFPMPWPAFAGMSSEDMDAVIAYLRTVPPIYNAVPERDEPNIFSYLWMKFQMLILKKPFPSFISPGNAGMAGEPSMSHVQTDGQEVEP